MQIIYMQKKTSFLPAEQIIIGDRPRNILNFRV